MKNKLMVFSLICMSLLVGCGGGNSTGTAATGTTSPLVATAPATTVTINGVTSTAAPSAFIGTWTGYVDDSTYTSVSILANGSITITEGSSAARTRLLVLDKGNYFIVNPETNTGVYTKSNGTALTIVINGKSQTFSKN